MTETKMPALNLPSYPAKIRTVAQRTQIFDLIRKAYVALTPEEWVRQHFINYMILEKKYPTSLIKVERGLKVNQLAKRTDIVAFNQQGAPQVLVECKAPDQAITQEVFDQASRYNLTLKARFLVVTNGQKHYCCKIDHQNSQVVFHAEFPDYDQVNMT